MNYINLDFCIIENPLDKNKRPIIFVTRNGRQYLDETVINEDDYEKAIFAIQDIGYVESDILTFESSQDPDFPNINPNDIKKILEEKGMKYSVELEETMKSEFELFNINGAKQFIGNLAELNEEKKNYITTEQMFSFNKKSRYKIPEIGEKLIPVLYALSDWSKEYVTYSKEDGMSDVDFLRQAFIKDKYKYYRDYPSV